ncbi:MAG: prepilin-type N-terminal cleavage/methylation domain-containing protein [Elusimicrobiaceae bacterium]|nr:prepilin-type N-terminal cleavage/methylation domain-containing protein [Elusimicrobiaceae bacterium]
MSNKIKNNYKGFTLIEILIVVLIIGVLASIALPFYRKAMEKAKAAEAIAVLNDAAKAEQDFALASSRYTSYWEDLIVNHPNVVAGTVYCIKGTNTANQDDCGNDSIYKVKLTVGDNDKSVVMATRTPNNPYADYKLFKFMNGDPNIYCRAAGGSSTDICAVLGFPERSLPEGRNVEREEEFECVEELPSCSSVSHPVGAASDCISYTPGYSCNKTIYDDDSLDRHYYYPNGEISEIFTYDANHMLLSEAYFREDDGLLGSMSFFEGGEDVLDFSRSDPATGQEYNIRRWENGHWSELTGYYPNGTVNDYRSWDTTANRWDYFVQYNEDGSVKNFTCYTSMCGGAGSCSGAACATSQYANHIPETSSLKPYNQFLNLEQVQQICNNANTFSFC